MIFKRVKTFTVKTLDSDNKHKLGINNSILRFVFTFGPAGKHVAQVDHFVSRIVLRYGNRPSPP